MKMQGAGMITFEGTACEFAKYFMPYLRNTISVLTKTLRDSQEGVCQECKSTHEQRVERGEVRPNIE